MKSDMRKVKVRLAVYILLTLALLIITLFGQQLAPHDPYATDFMSIDRAPGREFWFGTDNLGRDIFSRILTGARTSVSATFIVVGATALIGTVLGVIGGYFGGIIDLVLMKIFLILQSFPGEVMAIAVAGILGTGIKNATIALIFISWISYARLTRSLVLKIKDSNYIKAARLCGRSTPYILVRHVLPNISSALFVAILTSLSAVMMEISGLSFLGLSATPPFPEWGFMMNEGRKVLMTTPWQALVPGGAILVTVIILNRLGDSVRDYIECMNMQA